MKNVTRTRLAAVLFLPLAAILLATFACLPAPVGDPAKSKIDDALSGAWRGAPKDMAATAPTEFGKESVLVLLRPWDEHTYLMQYFTNENNKSQVLTFKAWLTQLGNATFITCKPMDDAAGLVGADPRQTYWAVLRLDKTESGMDVRMINPDNDLFKKLDKDKVTREQLETIIKAHLEEKDLYGDPLSFKKLTKSDLDSIEETQKKFFIEPTPK